MNDAGLVDALNLYWLNIGSGETATDTEQQARSTFVAQRAVNTFWHRYEWDFKQRSASVTVGATGNGDLPATFAAIGSQGGVYLPSNRGELQWIPANRLLRMREVTGASGTDRPLFYTVRGLAGAIDGSPLLSVYPKPAANISMTVYFTAKAPTVTYAASVALDQIPEQWHETVLFPLACSYLAFAEGDPRAQQLEAQANKAMAEAWAEQHPGVNQPKRRGPAYGRSCVRGYN